MHEQLTVCMKSPLASRLLFLENLIVQILIFRRQGIAHNDFIENFGKIRKSLQLVQKFSLLVTCSTGDESFAAGG